MNTQHLPRFDEIGPRPPALFQFQCLPRQLRVMRWEDAVFSLLSRHADMSRLLPGRACPSPLHLVLLSIMVDMVVCERSGVEEGMGHSGRRREGLLLEE